MNHNYLITGGAGFIGSHFTQLLVQNIEATQHIVVLDKLTYAGDLKRIESLLGSSLTFIQGDICDQSLVQKIMVDYEITCVVNFAAESHVDRSINSQLDFIHTNINGVQNLLNVTMNYWQTNVKNDSPWNQGPLMVHISTDEVYGGVSIDTLEARDEKTPLKPMNPYAATKASADMMIGAFQHTFDYPAVIIRPTNNYGHGQHEEKLIPKVINCLMTNKDIPLYGKGDQKRTWLHVNETAQGIKAVIDLGQVGEIYNIVGPTCVTNKALVETLIGIYNKSAESNYTGKIVYVEDRLGHDPYYSVSGQKLGDTIGFVPSLPLKTGLEKLVKKHVFSETFKRFWV